MRFIGFAILALALALSQGHARADGVIVSAFNCPPAIPCDSSDAGYPNADQAVAYATQCTAKNMTIAPNVPAFDSSGFDSSGCLTTNQAAFPGGKVSSAPQCCLKKMASGSCILHCDIIAH